MDQKEKEPMKRTSLVIPERLWKQLKIRSVEDGREMQDLLAQAVEEYLKKTKKGGDRR